MPKVLSFFCLWQAQTDEGQRRGLEIAGLCRKMSSVRGMDIMADLRP